MTRLRPTAARLSALPRELVLLLAVSAVLTIAWAVATAPLQGPDESAHYAYAQQLAETGRGPSPENVDQGISTEIGSALQLLNLRAIVGIPGALPPNTDIEERRWAERQAQITADERSDGTGPSPLGKNPQLYYVYEAVPYLLFSGADTFDRLMAMRLATGALYVLTVLLTWLLATEVFGRGARLRIVLATTVVALWPMLTFMSGVVNSDVALTAAYTGLALAAVRLVNRGPSLARAATTFLLAAVALLVHGRGVAAIGVALLAFGVAWVRHRPPLRRTALWAGAGVAAVAVPLLLSRVVFAPRGSAGAGGLYGGEATIPGQVFSVKQLVGQTWQFYFDRLAFMDPKLGPDYGYRQVVIERFVAGLFGSLEIGFPAWVYGVVQLAVAAIVIAAWSAAVLTRDRVRRAWPVLLTLGGMAAGILLLLHTASYRALTTGVDPLITGRYLLPLAPLAALALAWLVDVLPGRWRAGTAGLVVGGMLLLQLGGLALTVERFSV